MSILNRNVRGASALAAAALLFGAHAGSAQSEGAELSIAEVFYDAANADDQLEWIELVNDGDFPVDLVGFSLGWGGSSYLSGQQSLEGIVDPGDRFVVGGPLSSEANASPRFGLAVDLESDLQNSGATADGVALFDVPVEAVLAESIPIAVVVYGDANSSGLLDERGVIAAVDVEDAPAGSSIERGPDGIWRVSETPTPGAPPAPVPEPSMLVLTSAMAGTLLGLRQRPLAERPMAVRGQGARAKAYRAYVERSATQPAGRQRSLSGRTGASSGDTP